MPSHLIYPEPENKSAMFVSWLIIALSVTAGLLPLAIFIPDRAGRIVFLIMLAVFWIVMWLVALWIPAYNKTLVYTIEDEMVRMNHGVFWKRRVTVPYAKITNVDISQGPVQRMYNIGTIHVQTAGAGGSQGGAAELRMYGVRDLDDIRDIIMEQVLAERRALMGAKPSPSGTDSILSAILDETRSIRRRMDG